MLAPSTLDSVPSKWNIESILSKCSLQTKLYQYKEEKCNINVVLSGNTKNEAPPLLSQVRLLFANCFRMVCSCYSSSAVHFPKPCLWVLFCFKLQTQQTLFWEMLRKGWAAAAHHPDAVGRRQAGLRKQWGCLIFRISGPKDSHFIEFPFSWQNACFLFWSRFPFVRNPICSRYCNV